MPFRQKTRPGLRNGGISTPRTKHLQTWIQGYTQALLPKGYFQLKQKNFLTRDSSLDLSTRLRFPVVSTNCREFWKSEHMCRFSKSRTAGILTQNWNWSTLISGLSVVSTKPTKYRDLQWFWPDTGVIDSLIHALNKFHEHWITGFLKMAILVPKCCRNFQKSGSKLMQPRNLVYRHTCTSLAHIQTHLHP